MRPIETTPRTAAEATPRHICAIGVRRPRRRGTVLGVIVTLQVNLRDHPGGRRAYARDLEWPLPLPGPGDHVVLGPDLGQQPLVRRVFEPSGERVLLIFEPPNSVLDWARALEEAAWPLVA